MPRKLKSNNIVHHRFGIIFLVVSGLLTVFFCCTTTKNITSKSHSADLIDSLLTNKNYTIEVTTAHPRHSGMITLSGNFSLTISSDSINALLPYYGRAYKASPSSDTSPLDINALMINYSAKRNKNSSWEISFTTKNVHDIYTFKLSILPNATAYVSVIGQYHDRITFDGELDF